MESIAPSPVPRTRSHAASLRRAPLVLSLVLSFCFGLSMLGATEASAAGEPQYSSARKLGRGAANLGLGVIALPRTVYHTTRERGPFMGVTWGLVKGLGLVVTTELVGVWEVVTVPFQMPRDWKPVIDPEFPWQGFAVDER